jgi:hypothetical protein
MDNTIKILTFSFGGEKRSSQIEFYIPKDNILKFDDKKEHYRLGNELEFINYSGAIGVPSNVAINIPYSYNGIDISGIIASPAHITGLGCLELVIKPESNLELLIQADELLIVNKEYVPGNKEEYMMYNYGYGSRVFSDIKKEYLRRAIDNIISPKIIDTPTTYNADLKNSRFHNIRDIDICIKENIVNIMKFNGVTNVFDNNVEYKIIELNKNKSTGIDLLKQNLENALKKEEFEKAAKIRDEIKKRESKIYDD